MRPTTQEVNRIWNLEFGISPSNGTKQHAEPACLLMLPAQRSRRSRALRVAGAQRAQHRGRRQRAAILVCVDDQGGQQQHAPAPAVLLIQLLGALGLQGQAGKGRAASLCALAGGMSAPLHACVAALPSCTSCTVAGQLEHPWRAQHASPLPTHLHQGMSGVGVGGPHASVDRRHIDPFSPQHLLGACGVVAARRHRAAGGKPCSSRIEGRGNESRRKTDECLVLRSSQRAAPSAAAAAGCPQTAPFQPSAHQDQNRGCT